MEIAHNHEEKEVHIYASEVSTVDIQVALMGCRLDTVYMVFVNGEHTGNGGQMIKSRTMDSMEIDLEYRPNQPIETIEISVKLEK
jgi:hypothetical protein